MKKNILIITGEPSGDVHAGALLAELKKLLPDASFWGIGGDRMEKQGADLIEHVKNLSIVGVWEAVKNIPRIRAQYSEVIAAVDQRKPSLAILIDYPGFNLALARHLNKKNIPVIYYIIPQVWAWGHGRVKTLKRFADKILVLFDFEKKYLERSGIEVEFVGHPLMDKAASTAGTEPTEDNFTIALLPGSRKSEIQNMFSLMLDSAERINRQRKDTRFIVAETSNIDTGLYDSILAEYPGLYVSRVKDDTFAALDSSDFAMVTSGTATLEAAIRQKPMIITYRAAPLTAFLARMFVKIPFIGLANIIAGKEVVPELLQENATAEKLSAKVLEIINNDTRIQQMKDELKKVKESLGPPGASRRAAEAIHRFVTERGI